MHENDLIRLQSVQLGDQQALAELYECYSKIVYSVALRILRNPTYAEDVLQEVFLQIWRTPNQFLEAKGDLSTWLAVVSRNRAIDIIRRRRPLVELNDIVLISAYDLSRAAEQHIMYEKAKLLLAQLPIEQQHAITLAFFLDMSHVEVARWTGCPLGTIKTRIRSALRTLQKGLTAETSLQVTAKTTGA